MTCDRVTEPPASFRWVDSRIIIGRQTDRVQLDSVTGPVAYRVAAIVRFTAAVISRGRAQVTHHLCGVTNTRRVSRLVWAWNVLFLVGTQFKSSAAR